MVQAHEGLCEIWSLCGFVAGTGLSIPCFLSCPFRAQEPISVSAPGTPNPFSDQLVIETGSGNLGRVSIFNNTGELVRQLQPEQNRITWNGMNDFGLKCPPGIYFIRAGTSVQKVILTK